MLLMIMSSTKIQKLCDDDYAKNYDNDDGADQENDGDNDDNNNNDDDDDSGVEVVMGMIVSGLRLLFFPRPRPLSMYLS